MRRDLSGDARGRDDQSFGVAGEQLAVHPGLGVEAFGVGERGELDEIVIAYGVTGKQDEMVVRLAAIARTRAIAAVRRRDVGLHADDRLDAGLSRPLLKVPRAVKISMIRDREGKLLELLRAADQIATAVG